MGGWMPYGRVRHRNGLEWRPDGSEVSPYPCQNHEPPSVSESRSHLLIGDLNRMERDYLDPVYPQPPWATRPEGSDPSAECAAATGVDIETVRTVLQYVFLESR